jgi:hypothetical protein
LHLDPSNKDLKLSIENILYNTEVINEKEKKLEVLRKAKEEKELKDVTSIPKVNKKMNELIAMEKERITSGDHNIDLY